MHQDVVRSPINVSSFHSFLVFIYIHFQTIETRFIQAVLCSVTIFHGNTGDRIHIIMSVCTQMVSSKTQSKQVPLV